MIRLLMTAMLTFLFTGNITAQSDAYKEVIERYRQIILNEIGNEIGGINADNKCYSLIESPWVCASSIKFETLSTFQVTTQVNQIFEKYGDIDREYVWQKMDDERIGTAYIINEVNEQGIQEISFLLLYYEDSKVLGIIVMESNNS